LSKAACTSREGIPIYLEEWNRNVAALYLVHKNKKRPW